MADITWKWHHFNDLSGAEMHEIMAIRQQIFIIEQECIYLDADSYDKESFHLTGRGADGEIVAYARVNFPQSRFSEPSIGRVLTTPEKRGTGLAREAVLMAIQKCREEFAPKAIRISAQHYLQNFYLEFGFTVVGRPYDEDGIVHIDMLLEVQL